jgi:hypothetical protein
MLHCVGGGLGWGWGGCIPARILFLHYSEISTTLEISAGFGVACKFSGLVLIINQLGERAWLDGNNGSVWILQQG